MNRDRILVVLVILVFLAGLYLLGQIVQDWNGFMDSLRRINGWVS